MRYSTPACEGVCALNHYCAITRVDYREFRQCLETAASALASSSKSSGSTISRLTLLLTVFVSISKSPQRRLLIDWLHHFAFGVPRAAVTPLIQCLTRFAMLVVQCLVWVWLYWTTTAATASIPSTPFGLAVVESAALIAVRKSRRCTSDDVSFNQRIVHPWNPSYRILINPDKGWNAATTTLHIADGRCEEEELIAVVVIGNDDMTARRMRQHNNPSIAVVAVVQGEFAMTTTTWTGQMLLLFMMLPKVNEAKGLTNTMHIFCQSVSVNLHSTTTISPMTTTKNCCRQTRSTTTIIQPTST